ncbi:hypothetical protein [Streptomyces sp. MMS24-I29]|uniref:hypothetical protein n=1 Tax=Streptomyces sp. MMS24-I29 TaxID=3351480 RepID=UPI003C7C508D
MKIFGFVQDKTTGTTHRAPLPDDVQERAETVTLSGGQSWTDAKGRTYTTRSDED